MRAIVAIVDDILSYLRTNYKPGAGQFQRFNQKHLLENVRLRDIAKERGAKEQPASDTPDLDVIELDIVEAMRQQAIDDELRTREQLNHYTQRLKSANPAGQAAAMFTTAQDAVAAFRTAMLTARAVLGRARKNDIEREQQIAIFKAKNGLDRPPDPPKGHWVMSLVLAACFALEVGINASVLQSQSELGWLGGIVGAFFYTFISMGVALLVGLFGLTLLSHREWSWKTVGFVGLMLGLAIVLGVNLLAAHYRVAITSGLTELDAARHAANTAWHDTWIFLDDTQSIMMVGVSLIIAFITMIEGLFWRDTYPGYARVAKFSGQAHARWVRDVERYRAELDHIYDHHSNQIRALQASLSDRQTTIPQIIGYRRLLVQNFNAHLQHIQDVGRYLITNYREANCETRKSQKPKYFKQVWEMDAVLPMTDPDDSDAGDPKAWNEVGERLLEASRELNDAHADITAWIDLLGRSSSADDADALRAQGSRGKRPTLTVVEGAHEAQG